MSERYKSADEVLAKHMNDMGDELGRVYNALLDTSSTFSSGPSSTTCYCTLAA